MTPTRLLTLDLPLQGTHLIEASAGTGKTYTLAALYVRLVLGLGTTAFPDGLRTDQLLVLTFTRAATRELRQRIRERLALTADCLHGKRVPDDHDDFMRELLALAGDQRELLAKRASLAAREMDCASIHTIHGFCQRALKRFAFAAGQPFEQTLRQDMASLTDEVWRDYWRRFIQPLSGTLVDALLRQNLTDPAALQKSVKDSKIAAGTATAESLPAILTRHEQALLALAQAKADALQLLQQQEAELFAWFEQAKPLLNGKNYQANRLKELNDFIHAGTVKDGLARFTPGGFFWKKADKTLPLPITLTCLDALDHFLHLHAETRFPLDALLQHASQWTKAEVDQRLASHAEISFDSMVATLANTLKSGRGAVLAAQLREAWPCALIDEFQDTNNDQYAIFERIYGEAAAASSCWLMIGDPKQAIYGFRGADIQAYLQAAAGVPPDHRHTLGTNFRSAATLVEGVNHLFASSPLEAEEGGVFGADGIRFEPVHAKGVDVRFEVLGEVAPALTLCQLPGDQPQPKSTAMPALAGNFARRVAGLLVLGQQGKAGFRHDDGTLDCLKPKHITLLVRNHTEAAAIRRALQSCGVRSVYLADRENIYQSDEAADLLVLLRALATPQDAGLLRQAVATRLLAWPLADLLAMQAEDRWQTLLQEAGAFHRLWEKHGPLPMLHRLVHQWQLPARQQSERVLTNLFHLAELLQETRQTVSGIDEEVQALTDAIRTSTSAGEDAANLLPRLESEGDLVQVATLHGSKGLEYPLVLLPFASLAPSRATWQDEAGDDMRLLYVGITRARHACWLGWLDNRHGTAKTVADNSALGRLLFGTAGFSAERLTALCEGRQVTLDSSEPAPVTFTDTDLPTLVATAPQLPVRTPAGWTVTSYSRLSEQRSNVTFSINSERASEEQEDAATAVFTQPGKPVGVHAFPRGAAPGNLLHQLLEAALKNNLAADQRGALEQLVRRHARLPLYADQQALLVDWLARLLATPLLADADSTLAGVQPRLLETGFWLKLDATRTSQLDALANELLPGARAALDSRTLNGMLRGFIDLTFCHAGRHYVLDYKSNWLGNNNLAYTRANMQAAMLEHRYDLQALIYQQALHRLLQQRLPDYDPARHLGGCLYFFLRGIDSDSHGLIHLPPQPALLDEMEQLLAGEMA